MIIKSLMALLIFICALLYILFKHFPRALAPIELFFKSVLDRVTSKRRIEKIEREFPQAVELFAVLISGGMSPAMALNQLSTRIEGEYAKVLISAVQSMKSGATLSASLAQITKQIDSKIVRRFNDSLLLAMERGTPLSEVLAQQVAEVRSSQRNVAIERSAKAEITLMVPVVFLILPVSVLFALWPSYYALSNAGTL
jgi:tight adherence protein C